MSNIRKFLVVFTYIVYSTISAADPIHKEEQAVAESYDKDFHGGKSSLYNERFGVRATIPREEQIITKVFNNALNRIKKSENDVNTIVLLDFGCGDGRFLEFFQEIAESNNNVQIELIGYDISIVGLKEYANKLKQNSYTQLQDVTEDDNTYIFGIWKNKNLKITLIHSKLNNSLDRLQPIIKKPVNIVFNMFSVLCHIPSRANRQDIIKQLASLMEQNGEMVINVSTPKSIEKEFITYEVLRTQLDIAKKYKQTVIEDALTTTIRAANEPGDLYYSKSNAAQATHTYGHAYIKQELIEDINQANLKVKEVGVMSMDQPHELSRNFWKKYQDYLFSNILSLDLPFYPFVDSDKISKNIYAIAKK